MELVEGETLAHRIRRGPLPVDEIADVAAQICDALAAAHAAGIVHRDIKPGNVLITEAGQVKVCDFGIACHDSETLDDGSDMAVGTAQYMAPEQARGGPATPRTDLYGLGCVIYSMATGQPPFTSKTSARVAWQHLNETPVPLASRRPGTPSWLDGLVTSLLAKEPAQRPYSAVDVRGLLPSLWPKRETTTQPKPAAERAHRPARAAALSETTVHLAPPAAPLIARRVRLAATGVLSFLGLASVVLVLTTISGNDMPGALLNAPASTQPTQATQTPSPAQKQTQVQVQPVSNPANALDALRAVLDEQRRSGNIDGKPLRDLDKKLDEIQRDLARGEAGKAAGKLEDVAKTLAELRHEERIDAPTLYALQAALGDLAEQLPTAGDDD
jgi:serine/threonine-protein kinase